MDTHHTPELDELRRLYDAEVRFCEEAVRSVIEVGRKRLAETGVEMDADAIIDESQTVFTMSDRDFKRGDRIRELAAKYPEEGAEAKKAALAHVRSATVKSVVERMMQG